jgi:hypothetical protein
MQPSDQFEVIYKEQSLPVEKLTIGANTLFRIGGIGKTPLILTRAMGEDGKKFWTSIPEGRQNEALQIGPLIESYYRRQK